MPPDAVIRVYDAAATDRDAQAHGRFSKSNNNPTRLLIVQNRLRCSLVEFGLCAHFLQSRSKRCNLLLLAHSGALEILSLLRERSLQFLNFAMLFEKLAMPS